MQQGESQYGVSPEMASYAGTGSRGHMLDQLQQQKLLQQQQKSGEAAAALAEAASPISIRPPARVNFDELVSGASGFPDEDSLAGEDTERGVTSGNRWPRQGTLDLLKIRSEMDSTFKDATLKGPLWEDVSRKLAELGYSRSAKKCKEKFENLQKYYKRTKEGRAGRQDGKNYRFFSQLEALHSNSNANTTSTMTTATTTTTTTVAAVPISINNSMVASSSARILSPPISAPVLITSQRPDLTKTTPLEGISFSSNTSSSSGSEEEEMEEDLNMDTKKRKRTELGDGSSKKKMMSFFERLLKEVMEKQEGMLQRFLETIEKREQDRIVKEEAWRRQEMARLSREQEIMAQERAISASRDAAVISFLQQLTGQTIHFITPVTIPVEPAPQQQQQQQQKQSQSTEIIQQQQQQQKQSQSTEIIQHQRQQQQQQSTQVVVVQQEQQEIAGGSFDSPSSRWPKTDVIALINQRSALETKYQEAGPKGPLWEEISMGMKRLGYNRSSKRCKEKWENINKYFKKVKESNKTRPEDSKTCPYFYQLEELYRKKLSQGASSSPIINQRQEENLNSSTNPQEGGNVVAILSSPQLQITTEINTNNKDGRNIQIQTSNGGFFEEVSVKKPEDIVKELMSEHDLDRLEEDSDDLEDDEEDDYEDDDNEDDEEERKMAYKIQYQKPNPGASNGKSTTSSFLAMVQ